MLVVNGARDARSVWRLTSTVELMPVARMATASAAATSGRRTTVKPLAAGVEIGTGVAAIAAAIRSRSAGGAAIGGSTPSRRRIA